MDELFKFTLLLRGRVEYLTDLYSEHNERQITALGNLVRKI